VTHIYYLFREELCVKHILKIVTYYWFMLSIIITYILNSWKLRNFSECEFFDRSINVGKCGTVMDFWSTSHFYRFTRSLIGESEQHSPVSRESGEEDLGAAGLLRGAYSAGPVSQTCYWSKRRKLATRCNPRWIENPNSSLTQYKCGCMKPFIVSASSSSG
jgi:hypothetical protein